MNKNNIFSRNHFGFRIKLSTVGARASLTEEIRANWFRSKNLTKCSFNDLKKTFDTENHELVLKKCESYGIRGMILKMVDSYLKDRLKYIKLGKVDSEKKSVKFRVQRGAILGLAFH